MPTPRTLKPKKKVSPRFAHLREDVVVDESGVNGERSHQGDEVPPAEEDLPDLTADVLGLELALAETHPEAKGQDDEPVAGIT